MRRPLTVVSMALLLLAALLPASGSAQEPPPCDGDFHIVHELLKTDEQNDVDFAPDGEGWSIGTQVTNPDSEDPTHTPLAVRFDDDGFERLSPPSDPSVNVELSGLDVITSDDIYAVGHAYSGPARTTGVAYHWDGATWTEMDVPTPGKNSWLREVAAASPTDVWAVGEWQRRDRRVYETLVLHNDGTTWRRVPAPSPGKKYANLNDVDVIGPSRAWAVGYWGNMHPLALKWNGTEWRRVRMPNADLRDDEAFFGVDASPTDVWMVGDGRNGSLVVHRVEGRWVRSGFHDVSGEPILNEVAADGDQVWVAGRYKIRDATFGSFAAHWKGSFWQESDVEGHPSQVGDLDSVALDPAGNAWAVGDYQASDERYDMSEVIDKACV